MMKMKKYDSKNKFLEFNLPSHYLRVDDKHPLELLIGLNNKGQKSIRFIGKFSKVKVKSTKTIEINHFMIKDQLVLNFSLIDEKYEDLFYLFCNDLIDSSRQIENKDGYQYLINRFDKWKGFGSFSRRYLSEVEIKGLIGELLFLKEEIFLKYGEKAAIAGWTGPEPLKKDFSFDDYWYEVKTISKDIVTISSLEQLDSDYEGYLVVYYLEKLSSEAKGVTINTLFNEINEILENEENRSSFTMKLLQYGFYCDEYYDQFVYRNIKKEYYQVLNDFPRVTKDILPLAISNVKYDIIINMIDNFKVDKI